MGGGWIWSAVASPADAGRDTALDFGPPYFIWSIEPAIRLFSSA